MIVAWLESREAMRTAIHPPPTATKLVGFTFLYIKGINYGVL